MPRPPAEYKRLPGKRRGFLGVSSLWLGPDHLLSIFGKGYSEAYKRFYYKDIQNIIVQRTESAKYTNIAAGLGVLLFLLFAWLAGETAGLVLAVVAVLFLTALLVNLVRGHSCRFFIQTAVQLEKLPSVHRVKDANRILDKVRPKIETAQGMLSREIMNNDPQAAPMKIMAGPKPSALRHEKGNFHLIAFGLLLIDGLLTIVDIFVNSTPLTVVETLIALLTAFFVITALVKQHGSDIEGPLSNLTWAGLAYVLFSFASGYVMSMVISIENPETINNYYKLVQEVAALNALDNPWLLGLAIFSTVYSLAVSISGLVLLAAFRNQARKVEVNIRMDEVRT